MMEALHAVEVDTLAEVEAHEDVFGVRLAERILVLDELDARCAVLVEEALPVLALFEAGPPDV